MELSKLTQKRIQEYLKEGRRFDNRKPYDFRDIIIETDTIKNADGSARVKFGDTEVLVGVKLDVGEPYPDSKDAGTLITTAELLPLSSPRFEPGPPGIEAIEIARIVDRGIRESGFIDFKKLCIKEGEKVWNVLIDIYSINEDGNLIDASAIGAIAALKTARMPKYNEKTERVEYGELTTKKIPLTDISPLTVTFYKIGKETLVDPSTEEEASSQARLSLTLSRGKDGELRINATQKGGEEAFDEKEIISILDGAEKTYQSYISKIEKNLKLD